MKTNQKTNEKSGNKSKGCKYSGSDKEHKVAWSWDDSGGSWLFDDLGCCVCPLRRYSRQQELQLRSPPRVCRM